MQKDTTKALIAAVLLLAAGGLVFYQYRSRHAHTPGQEYYLDLDSGKLFPATIGQFPPVPSPTGGTGVRAHVVSCGPGCSEAERKIAYLEKYADDVRPLIGKTFTDFDEEEANNRRLQMGLLVAAPVDGGGEPQWVPAASAMGETVASRPRTLCGGSTFQFCRP